MKTSHALSIAVLVSLHCSQNPALAAPPCASSQEYFCPSGGQLAQAPCIISNIVETKILLNGEQTTLACGIKAVDDNNIMLAPNLNSVLTQNSDGSFIATIITPAGPMVIVRNGQSERVKVELVNRHDAVIANECDFLNGNLSNCKIGEMFIVPHSSGGFSVVGQIHGIEQRIKEQCATMIADLNQHWITGEPPNQCTSPLPQDEHSILERRGAFVSALALK